MSVCEPKVLENLFSLYRAIGERPEDVDWVEGKGFELVHAKESVWPNMAFNIDEEAIDHEMLASVSREMTSFGSRPSMIVHYSTALPGVMRPSGYFPVDQWVGMRYSLAGMVAPADVAGSPCVLIQSRQELEDWVKVVSETLFENNRLNSGIFAFLRSKGAELVGLRVGDEMVGSSMIYYDRQGMPGIYMVGIKKEYRGKGLGRAIARYCLWKIKESGADVCCLQATRAGLGMYKAMDFEELDKYLICCKIK